MIKKSIMGLVLLGEGLRYLRERKEGDWIIHEKEKEEFTVFSSRSHSPDLCGDVLWLSS